ncbi:MAG TPA: hypothetical protein VKU94_02345 [Geobacterales bacterium]|nr:hypothetical protein [Geobacterales bacterium]
MKLLITTSRRPSRRTRSFVRDLALLFNAERITRGKSSIDDLLSELVNGSKLLVIDTKKGNPSRIRVYDRNGLLKIYILRSVKLLREIKGLKKVSFSKIPVLAEDDFSKNFAELFNLSKAISKNGLHIEFLVPEEKDLSIYREFTIKDGLNIIAKLFLLKEWNDKISSS